MPLVLVTELVLALALALVSHIYVFDIPNHKYHKVTHHIHNHKKFVFLYFHYIGYNHNLYVGREHHFVILAGKHKYIYYL
jgi:hypothetical protein